MAILTSFTPMERKLIAFVLAVITGGLVVNELRLFDRPVVTITRVEEADAAPETALPGITHGGLIDINRADQATLESLPGVGPALAADIVAHRQQSGGFRSAADLDAVPGIGPAKLGKMESFVTFGAMAAPGAPVATSVPAAPVVPMAALGAAPVPRRLINLNRATQAELESLHKVGPALAQRIIDYRRWAGGFRSVEQIVEVKGVGPAILKANRHLLTTQ